MGFLQFYNPTEQHYLGSVRLYARPHFNSGGGYVISQKTLSILAEGNISNWSGCEDMNIARALRSRNIEPENTMTIDMKERFHCAPYHKVRSYGTDEWVHWGKQDLMKNTYDIPAKYSITFPDYERKDGFHDFWLELEILYGNKDMHLRDFPLPPQPRRFFQDV